MGITRVMSNLDAKLDAGDSYAFGSSGVSVVVHSISTTGTRGALVTIGCPGASPTDSPSRNPTHQPTTPHPSPNPSPQPTTAPTRRPTDQPTVGTCILEAIPSSECCTVSETFNTLNVQSCTTAGCCEYVAPFPCFKIIVLTRFL